jgi:hypothetical protein|tara:strand:- start:237 stop:398 length:162 start_codon:yes stop_codon:yes gene_type:complete
MIKDQLIKLLEIVLSECERRWVSNSDKHEGKKWKKHYEYIKLFINQLKNGGIK